jgi:hypothetical protein
VTRTAFLAAFKRLGGRASGKYRKQCGCGKGDCYAMAHGFSFFLAKAKISVVISCPRYAAASPRLRLIH